MKRECLSVCEGGDANINRCNMGEICKGGKKKAEILKKEDRGKIKG
jgi:hypothetical protein